MEFPCDINHINYYPFKTIFNSFGKWLNTDDFSFLKEYNDSSRADITGLESD